MKISTITLAIAITLGATSFTAVGADLDGTIEFTGSLTTSTCLIEGHPPGGNAARVPVNLGGVPVAKLATPGSAAGDRGFTITVGGANDTGCEDGKLAKVGFDTSSPLLDTTTGRLNIDTGTGAASGVQIEVANQDDDQPIHMFTERSHPVVVANHTAVIPLIARYRSDLTNPVVPGTANSRIGFNVTFD